MSDVTGPRLRIGNRNGPLCQLLPGEKKLMGRAPAADVRLVDGSVSRLHARLQWPQGRARPTIEDLHSANGVWLDGVRLAGIAELRDGMHLEIGCFALVIGLIEDCAPALLDDGGTAKVRLFSESGPELEGAVAGSQHVRDLLLHLERGGRTGTLTLSDGREVTFASGRVVQARTPRCSGAEALTQILSSGAGTYHFSLDVAASEAQLCLSIRVLLERKQTETQRCPKLTRSS